jgi:cathepsin L
MNKLVLLLVVLPALISCLSVEHSFHAWTQLHGKKYDHINEHNYRLSVYKSNLEYIESHNRQNHGFTLAMNKFGDLTNAEFRAMYLMPKFNGSSVTRHGQLHVSSPQAPASVDWRAKGVVTEVKNQGQCGSCWAFSTTGSVEGAWGIKKGKSISVSEQQLVDCSGSYGNYGCDGGLMDSAFQYIIAVKGLDTEDDYPYTAEDGTCEFDIKKVASTISSYKDVKSGSESDLVNSIAQQPVSVAIDASQSSFQFYSGGVYFDKYCSSTQLDHGVLAVGYDTDTTKKSDYYIVKNSWGTDWGVAGYILMSRNKNNNCGIATMSSYPIV